MTISLKASTKYRLSHTQSLSLGRGSPNVLLMLVAALPHQPQRRRVTASAFECINDARVPLLHDTSPHPSPWVFIPSRSVDGTHLLVLKLTTPSAPLNLPATQTCSTSVGSTISAS